MAEIYLFHIAKRRKEQGLPSRPEYSEEDFALYSKMAHDSAREPYVELLLDDGSTIRCFGFKPT